MDSHKVCQVIGHLYRKFYPMANAESLIHLYTTLVLPHLEYACPVWAPHTHKDTELLENIQRFACKMATHCWNSSYEELLALTNLPTLERRRLHLKLSHLYKIVHHQSFFPNGVVSLREHSVAQHNSCSVHSLTLQSHFARTQSYYHSFVPHTITIWNTLPYEVTSCTTFKTSFMSYLSYYFITLYHLQTITLYIMRIYYCYFIIFCGSTFIS